MRFKTFLPWIAVVVIGAISVVGCDNSLSGPSNPDESSVSLGKKTRKATTTRRSTPTGTQQTGGTQSTGGATPSYDGCVKEVGYWQCNLIAWPPPYQGDLQFCVGSGATYYEVLFIQSASPLIQLAQNYIGALLNKTRNGGAIPPEVQAAINEAQLFFNNRDLRVPLTQAETEQALRLLPIFFDFNNGLGGLALCP